MAYTSTLKATNLVLDKNKPQTKVQNFPGQVKQTTQPTLFSNTATKQTTQPVQTNSYGIDYKTAAKIKDKASRNEALMYATPEKQAAYNQYQQEYIGKINQKASTGEALTDPNAWKQSIYDSYAKPFDQDAYLKDRQGQVNSIYDQQKAAQMAQFNAERDKAMGLINQQKAEVAPQYANKRNQADVVNAQNVSRLREMMAANGISASGENVTANVALGSARQGALSQLNLQEQQTNNDFNRQITDINNPERINAMIAQLEAQRSEALYNASNRADDVGYSRGRDATMDGRYTDERDYGRQQDDKQWDYQTDRDSINDGRYEDDKTYNRGQDSKQWDYQTGRDAVQDGRYDKEWGYNVGRDKIADGRWDKEWDYQQKRDGISDSRYNASRSGRGGGGGSSYGSSYGGGGSSPQLPSNPTKPRIMTEQQYIDALEESDARKKGTARVLPGSTDYENKMKRVLRDLYK